ncbi:MAG: PKD domain-containing protein, partial [Nanoarchaeota archaeon]|nr:PKD domain-containing protein [Nanoarchaeota archaeon]
SLKDFLYNNSINCESSSICYCFPSDCKDNYISNNGKAAKNFSLDYNEEKIISFLVEGNINSISGFEFNVSVTNSPSCLNPLKIDILNDESIEWNSKKHNNEFACTYQGGMGCFNSGSTLYPAIIDNAKPYCEKIGLVEGNNFSIGSWIKKGSTVWSNGLLEMSLYDLYGNLLDSCNLPEPSVSGGEISCSVEYDNPGIQDYYVCVQATKSVEGYETKRESADSCGFYAIPGEETEYHDYYIFARASKFDYIGKFKFNQDEYEKQGNAGELSEYANNYISQKYKGSCANGCSIPIKFKSYSNLGLSIEVSDVKIKYSTGSGPSTSNLIYDTNFENAKISSNFSKLDLAKANLLVPSSYGNKTLSLKLNGEEILEKSIKVLAVPKITDILPNEVPALVSYSFIVFLDTETSNLTYTWDFGDNTTKQTTTGKTLEHAYSKIGNYVLSVTVSNKYGNSSKTISVKVGSPKDYVNDTINDYSKKLGKIEAEINKTEVWIQNEIKKKYDISSIKSQLDSQKKEYNEAFSDEDYTKIMEALIALDIPDSFNLSQKITPSEFFPDSKQINLAALEYLGAGKPDGTEEEYTNAVTYWFMNALQMTIESKTYALYYKDEVKDLLSYAKVTLTPKENQKLGTVYFLVNGNPDEIKFNTDKTVKTYDDAAGVIFPGSESQETI